MQANCTVVTCPFPTHHTFLHLFYRWRKRIYMLCSGQNGISAKFSRETKKMQCTAFWNVTHSSCSGNSNRISQPVNYTFRSYFIWCAMMIWSESLKPRHNFFFFIQLPNSLATFSPSINILWVRIFCVFVFCVVPIRIEYNEIITEHR